ncbi:hypothetical protein Ptr902_03749 [Pyrenophora tritici-repentis]|uniref:Uncharacterized protein n=1 Tax=Pyrenophora tritici-repentis TaxID=45151 RepID=A0A5M9LB36_9PLEO|nr:hypothetical protein PtrV1_08826 [Pyrenophora tritici-repentis]KAF7449832.1 hypothetical protein A1F99_068810 [Pyrenophora tritici-repentis]KAF7570040.1 hypothetical protein PtrM4_100420 [Pyrenophora tritici-repentis]KAI0568793.1 hypothetical protein Alg215_11993 [Pyrenophora tritici-repentis]KAI2484809.1 hypothetical protein Ptr902_03749 [Pyrenophora tritici-repentis]
MRNYLPLAFILLAPAVSAWNACHCAGEESIRHDQTAGCCERNGGVTFPKTPREDTLARWDGIGKQCLYSGPVVTQNTELEAQLAFSACCRSSGNRRLWGALCFSADVGIPGK